MSGDIVIYQAKWNSLKSILGTLVIAIILAITVFKTFSIVDKINGFELILLWIETFFLVVFTILVIYFIIKSLRKNRPILKFGQDSFITRGSFTSATIKYKDIAYYKEQKEKNATYLLIKLKDKSTAKTNLPITRRLAYSYNLEARKYEISLSGLDLGDHYDEVLKIIKQKAR
ncbi:MAG: STM3941 family protein [Sarcina sp.]